MSGKSLRDEGVKKVLENNAKWATLAHNTLVRLKIPQGSLVTGEDLRQALSDAGVPEPRHPNAWGGFIASLVWAKAIEDSGRTVCMKRYRSHARRTPLWFWKGFNNV